VERARGGDRARGGVTSAIDADRQTDKCRISQRGFDPSCQHHDAGAEPRNASRAAPASSGSSSSTSGSTIGGSVSGNEYAIAVTTPGLDGIPNAGGGQKTARAETGADGRTGSACASAGPRSCTRSSSAERVILSNASAEG
jgi:hypothetical protein